MANNNTKATPDLPAPPRAAYAAAAAAVIAVRGARRSPALAPCRARGATPLTVRGARLACLLSLSMLLAPSGTPGQEAAETEPEAPAIQTVTIPGTLVSFDLARLPAIAASPDSDPPSNDAAPSPLWMATTEVTWDAFDVFLYKLDQDADLPDDSEGAAVDALARPTTPYIAVDRGFGHSGYPALSVSAHNARAYCAWLSAATGLSFRLPQVSEWQAACRADGAEPNRSKESLSAVAWYRGNARYKTHPVAGKPANAWGLHDLQGNVSEWALSEGGEAVLLGGSYLDGLSQCACERLREDTPHWNASDPNLPKSVWWLADGSFIGLRVVCDGPLRGPAVSSGDTRGVSDSGGDSDSDSDGDSDSDSDGDNGDDARDGDGDRR